jgi:hypothetical protein
MVDIHVPSVCECGTIVVGIWYRSRPYYCHWFRHARYAALRTLLEQNRCKNKYRPNCKLHSSVNLPSPGPKDKVTEGLGADTPQRAARSQTISVEACDGDARRRGPSDLDVCESASVYKGKSGLLRSDSIHSDHVSSSSTNDSTFSSSTINSLGSSNACGSPRVLPGDASTDFCDGNSNEDLLAPKFMSLLCMFQMAKHQDAVGILYPQTLTEPQITAPAKIEHVKISAHIDCERSKGFVQCVAASFVHCIFVTFEQVPVVFFRYTDFRGVSVMR